MQQKRVSLTDVTLRDGMHAASHQLTLDEMIRVSTALDEANVDIIEVTHGDGLGGSSLQYGRGRHTDEEYLSAVVPRMKHAKVSVLLVPGIGTIEMLEKVIPIGIKTVRVATHCTEADVSDQHIRFCRDHGLDTVGFLMMVHMLPPDKLVEQAKKMESYGANCIYVTDSAGALVPRAVSERIEAVRKAVKVDIGFHAHQNLSLAVANSLAAISAGATRIDASLAGMGAGAGNTPMEVLAAVLDKEGIETGADIYRLMDAAEDIVRPMLRQPLLVDRTALSMGYAGVYSSFMLHARKAAERFGLDPRDILQELGRRKMVGGQEDMIIDVALDMLKSKGQAK